MIKQWVARAVDLVFGYDFFLSYSHGDGKHLPLHLHKRLEQSGFRVFLDQTGYVAGHDLRRETSRQVGKSRKLVVLGRPMALASPWVHREVEVAIASGNVPVLVNINDALTNASVEASVASLALQQDWLRLDETLADADGEPSDRLIAELIRSFSYTRQETQRIRVFAGAALLLMCVAVLAIWMAFTAESQRRVAEQNLMVARQAADVLVIDIARGLRDVKGMDTAALHRILSKAREAFDKLSESFPSNEALLRSRLIMQNEFVETYLAQGDMSNASESAKESLALAEQLTGYNDKTTESNILLARSLTKVGDVLEEEGAMELSRQVHLQALAIRRRLSKALPDDIDFQREVTISLVRLGQLELTDGKLINARAFLDEALPIRERLARLKPPFQRDLALLHLVMSDVELEFVIQRTSVLAKDTNVDQFAESPHLTRAAEHASTAAALFEQLSLSDPVNSKAARDYAIAQQRLGNIALQAHDYPTAREYYQLSAKQYGKIAEGDYNNLEWRRDLLVAESKLAAVEIATGNCDKAARIFVALIDQREVVVDANPDNYIWRTDLIETLRDQAALRCGQETARLRERACEHLMILKSMGALKERERGWLTTLKCGEF